MPTYDELLADVLRAEGLTVVEHAGWRTRPPGTASTAPSRGSSPAGDWRQRRGIAPDRHRRPGHVRRA